jgi:DNA-binding transcriptional ArsR family regulator
VAVQQAITPDPPRPMPPHTPAATDRLRRADIPATTDRRRRSSASDVLCAVLDHGPVPRSTIARLAGLSPAAVSRHCADLVRAGLVREVPRQGGSNGAGRPHVPVDISDERHVVCGLHIGATASTLAMVDLRGRVIAWESYPYGGQPAADVLTRGPAQPGQRGAHVRRQRGGCRVRHRRDGTDWAAFRRRVDRSPTGRGSGGAHASVGNRAACRPQWATTLSRGGRPVLRAWQVLGSNQRRLSRRFYGHLRYIA